MERVNVAKFIDSLWFLSESGRGALRHEYCNSLDKEYELDYLKKITREILEDWTDQMESYQIY